MNIIIQLFLLFWHFLRALVILFNAKESRLLLLVIFQVVLQQDRSPLKFYRLSPSHKDMALTQAEAGNST